MTRQRWRITLDELAYQCGVPASEVQRWADIGALGSRYAEGRDQGFGRHITREAAQRAVLMARLTQSGVNVNRAARITVSHTVRETDPLTVDVGQGVKIIVDRSDLP